MRYAEWDYLDIPLTPTVLTNRKNIQSQTMSTPVGRLLATYAGERTSFSFVAKQSQGNSREGMC